MPRHTARPIRVICLVLLALGCPLAATSGAESVTYTTPGTYTFAVPPNVSQLHVVAVGGRGGGATGGFGAVVSGDLRTSLGVSGITFQVVVPGNGTIGAGGDGGGGGTPLGSLAGGGGGSAAIARCFAGSTTCLSRQIVAAGGGGAGADSFPGAAGAGGNAGATGASGETVDGIAGGGGGQAGTDVDAGAGGAGGLAPDAGCDAGEPGAGALFVTGAAGGSSADPLGFGDGGGGGAGMRGGGGGGAGGYCADVDEGLGGGGGGGGSSLVPAGGTLGVDTTGVPSVTISWTPNPPVVPGAPVVTVDVPADGATYGQREVIAASYACARGTARTSVVSCHGPVENGRPIETGQTGSHEFKVVATTRAGESAEKIVHYTVEDRTAPAMRGLRVAPRVIELDAARAFARVSFRLSERARVLIRVKPARSRPAQAARVRARVLIGRVGRNGFRLRPRLGGRTLRLGAYHLILVAIDAAGNRSRPMRRRFTVVE